MKIFFDTSSLCKKYFEESGSISLLALIQEASEIIISPLTWVELNSAPSRRIREGSLSRQQVSHLMLEAKRDFYSFHVVIWNQTLEETAAEIVYKYSLSTLDAIQLASGIHSEADEFVSSDKKLLKEAGKVLEKTRFI